MLIFVTLLVPLSYIMRPIDSNNSKKRHAGFYAEEVNSLDIIGYGSSAIYRYLINPVLYQDTGLTSYSFCSADLPPEMIPYYIEESLKTQSPKLAIIDVRAVMELKEKRDLNDRFFRLSVDNLKYSPTRLKAVLKLAPKDMGDDGLQTYVFDIIKYHVNWNNPEENDNGEAFDTENLKYATFEKEHAYKSWGNLAAWNKFDPGDFSDVKETMPVTDYALSVMDDIIESVEEHDLEVLFTMAPYVVESAEEQMKQNFMVEYIQSKGHKCVDFSDYRKEMGLDYTFDYYGVTHVNMFGAVKFTKFLGKYIEKNYDLEPNHTETTVDSWDEALENYKEDSGKFFDEIEQMWRDDGIYPDKKPLRY